jgi:hypothetical protein
MDFVLAAMIVCVVVSHAHLMLRAFLLAFFVRIGVAELNSCCL